MLYESTKHIPDPDVATECIICGNHIAAGSYPPVCCDHCRWEFEINCERIVDVKDLERRAQINEPNCRYKRAGKFVAS